MMMPTPTSIPSPAVFMTTENVVMKTNNKEYTRVAAGSAEENISGDTATTDDNHHNEDASLQEQPFQDELPSNLEEDDNEVNGRDGIILDTIHSNVSNPTNKHSSIYYKARRCLWLAHFVSQLAIQVWYIYVYIVLAAVVHNNSLLWVSSFYLSCYATAMLCSTPLGRWMDGQQAQGRRLYAAKKIIVAEKISVAIAVGACCWLLLLRTTRVDNSSDAAAATATPPLFLALMTIVHIFGSLAQVLDQGFSMAMERDWIVVLSSSAMQALIMQQQQQSAGRQQEELERPRDTSTTATPNSERFLSHSNVVLRQIHLICKILAPALVGVVYQAAGHVGVFNATATDDATNNNTTTMSSSETAQSKDNNNNNDLFAAAALLVVLTVLSLFMECVALSQACRLVPALNGANCQVSDTSPKERSSEFTAASSSIVEEDKSLSQNTKRTKRSYMEISTNDNDQDDETDGMHFANGPNTNGSTFCRAIFLYWQQPMWAAGVSFALINANVLCFGGVMDTYLLWKGMSVEQVGAWKSLASAMGFVGTLCYKVSTTGYCCNLSVVATGTWSILFWFVCLSVACASFFVQNNDHVDDEDGDGSFPPASIYMLVVGTAAGRIGLWVFDISVTMLYQETVQENVRIVTGGTQQSLNSFFTMASGALGLVFRKPEQFVVIALAGYACIAVAMVLYLCFVARRGAHFSPETR